MKDRWTHDFKVGDVLTAIHPCKMNLHPGHPFHGKDALIVGKDYVIAEISRAGEIRIKTELAVTDPSFKRHQFTDWRKYFVKKSQKDFQDQINLLY
jgi:ribosomal protein L21E